MANSVPSGSRWFAGCWRFLERPADEMLRPAKQQVFVDLPSRLVEIGPGRGSNFAYYRPNTFVLAFEPNEHMHDALRARALENEIELEIRSDDFRGANLPADSEKAVITTLVLCSVGDVRAMVGEIHRVLEPAGRLIFLEHVDKEPGTVGHTVQRIIHKPWKKLGGGCNLLPGTVAAIEGAGFASIHTIVENGGRSANPASLTYRGTATK